jgi:hypothetical protein
MNKSFKLNSLNVEEKFIPKEASDPINYRIREDSKHEFGTEYEKILPSEGEVRLLGNRHKDCRYFSLGIIILFIKVCKCASRE